MFSNSVVDNCIISKEDWTKPLFKLDKESVYIINSYDSGNIVTLISYKDGVFYFANKFTITSAEYYRFENLQESYDYFKKVFG